MRLLDHIREEIGNAHIFLPSIIATALFLTVLFLTVLFLTTLLAELGQLPLHLPLHLLQKATNTPHIHIPFLPY